MILSNDCWMRDTCGKIKKGNTECLQADLFCKKLFRVDYLFNQSLLSIPQRKRVNFTFDTGYKDEAHDLQQIKEIIIPIEEDIETFVNSGRNVYIHSANCGNGKTSWAIRLIQDYINAIWYKSDLKCRALFINVPRFLLTLKDNITDKSDYIQHIKDNVLEADLVVWDEVGVKSLTTYEHENLYNLINTRIDAGKSNIYTSNLSKEELEEKIGERLYSRIVNLSTEVLFIGVDKRGIK